MEQIEQSTPMTGILQDQAAQKQEQASTSVEHAFGRRRFLWGAGYGSLALAGGSLLAWESQRGTAHAAANTPLGTLQSPVLIHASDAVKPGQLLSLNGEWLDAASAQVTVNGQAASIVQTDAQGHFLVVRVPQQLTPGILQATVNTSAGHASFPVNQPRPLFISEYEAWAGQQIEIVGRNFDPTEYGASGTPQVKLVDNNNGQPNGATYAASVVSHNPYNITFTVPSVPLGTYYWIYVSTDNQATWWPVTTEPLTVVTVGQDPLGLGVAWANHFNWNQVFNVTSYGVPTTGGVDVTAQVQAVVNTAKAAGGGVVYFPAGKYQLSAINLPAYVVLQGAGQSYTTLICANPNTAINSGFIFTSGDGVTLGHQGVARLLIELANDADRPDAFIWLGETWDQFSSGGTLAARTASEMFVKEVNINYSLLPPSNAPGTAPRGIGLEWFGKQRVVCDDNSFVGFHAQPYINFITDYASLKRNHFEYSTGGLLVSTGGHTFIENNMVIGHREYNGQWGDLHGLDSRTQTYYANNTIEGIGTLNGALNTIFNDGEVIFEEVAGHNNFNYGSVTAATATTLTISPIVPLTTPNPEYGYVGVVIIDGRGLGQLRRVTNINLTSNVLTIDHPWNVVPDTTSAFSLLAPIEQVTHYRNRYINCTKGLYFFGNHFDSVQAENNSANSEGCYLWAVRSPQGTTFSGFIPSYFVRFARNTVAGISVKSQHGGMSYNLARADPGSGYNGAYFGTMAYGIEMVDNFISGDPTAVPLSQITEAPPYPGLAAIAATYSSVYNGDPGSGDGKNTVLARNILTELSTGINLTHALYGTVVADNSYSPTVGTFLADTGSLNTVTTNNNQISSFNNFQTDLTGWAAVNGTWSAGPDGEHGTSPGGDAFFMSTQSGTNFVYEGDLSLTSNNPTSAALVFRSQANPLNGSYVVNISTENGGQIKLFKFPYVPLAIYPTTFSLNKTYHITVIANGSSLMIFLNGGATPVIQVMDSSYTSGLFGLNAWNGSGVYQNIQVSS